MLDAQRQPGPDDEGSFQITQQPSGLPWPAIGIGLVFIAVIVGLGLWLSRGTQQPASTAPPAYATQLKISGIKMSQAQNFVGGTVTYVEGQITNTGDKTVTGATVEATFKNSLDEVVQQEPQPLKLLDRTGAYPDAIDPRASPLKPQQTWEFRLVFEHISADWNQTYPELKITAVTLQ